MERASKLFDRVIVAVAANADKQPSSSGLDGSSRAAELRAAWMTKYRALSYRGAGAIADSSPESKVRRRVSRRNLELSCDQGQAADGERPYLGTSPAEILRRSRAVCF